MTERDAGATGAPGTTGAASPGLRIEDLLQAEAMRRSFERNGLSEEAARTQAGLLERCAAALLERGVEGTSPARAFHVPGRIEVLGKHTDYCGGQSLLAATEQGFVFAAVKSEDERIDLVDAVRSERLSFPFLPRLSPLRSHWANYPMTVARRLARNFPGPKCGVRAALASSLPPAAGLSTSSAFVVGVFQVLAGFNKIVERSEYRSQVRGEEALASYLAAVENGSGFGSLAGDRGVGTEGGSEDHTAILRSIPAQLSLYSFSPARLQRRVPLGSQWIFAVASSGVAAEKTGGARDRFNRASRAARALVDLWNQATGSREAHLAGILARGPEGYESLRKIVDRERHPQFSAEDLLRRLEHFREESEKIIPQAASALDRGDLDEFGRWADVSQDLGARQLGNQIPETVFLASEARRQGARGASAFGAGFGGSVWALCPRSDRDEFLARWRAAYEAAFPGRSAEATFFATAASGAAFEISVP